MKVSLREITADNFKVCVNLKVAERQKTFVAPNVMSIAQSKVSPTYLPFAVYAGEEMVGFVMYGLDTDDNRYYLSRLMIDEKHQGKGYGRAATLEVIERLKNLDDCREIFLSFVPGNNEAEKLYLDVGFEKLGETNEGGEIVMRLRF
ncbi:MAG: GNAT family N-acetyltransferase [Pyrinomonadaceae bacterium]